MESISQKNLKYKNFAKISFISHHSLRSVASGVFGWLYGTENGASLLFAEDSGKGESASLTSNPPLAQNYISYFLRLEMTQTSSEKCKYDYFFLYPLDIKPNIEVNPWLFFDHMQVYLCIFLFLA